jgi:hypothetical protein
MSLLHLVHRNVVIKFADASRNQFSPEAFYAFRLTGVDAMGFLQLQDLKPADHGGHETVSEPYWINKDFIREIHELDLAKVKDLQYNGQSSKPQIEVPVEHVPREVAPKPPKAKLPAKAKTVLKQKPILN